MIYNFIYLCVFTRFYHTFINNVITNIIVLKPSLDFQMVSLIKLFNVVYLFYLMIQQFLLYDRTFLWVLCSN